MVKVIDFKPSLQHPYMDVLQKTLETQKRLLELLERRVIYLSESIDRYKDNKVLDAMIENNGHEIALIDLSGRIGAVIRSIKEKETYFIKYMQQFTLDADQCEKEFDDRLKKAKELSKTNGDIKDLLARVNYEMVEKNIEVKIELFKRLGRFVK